MSLVIIVIIKGKQLRPAFLVYLANIPSISLLRCCAYFTHSKWHSKLGFIRWVMWSEFEGTNTQFSGVFRKNHKVYNLYIIDSEGLQKISSKNNSTSTRN